MTEQLKKPAQRPRAATDRRRWANRFVIGILLWLIPAAAAWLALTSLYNPFLTKAAENLVRLTESPSVTRLLVKPPHHFVITRTDVPSAKGWLSSVRVTDTHFPLIMMLAFFLAVPGIPWKRKLENLAWACLILVFFHIFSLFLWVKFVYATQLGDFSAQNYSAFKQNFWGLAKHLADLPFKLGMPLMLWAAFYIRELIPPSQD